MENPPEHDSILKNLKIYTGWNQIYKGNTGYIIAFPENDAHMIKGLKHDDETFFLDFDDFKTVPLAFHITRKGRHFQYWTVNKKLHRLDDQPSYVMYDPIGKHFHRRWFWNGILHRPLGPADETAMGYEIDDESSDTHLRESWDSMEYFWYIEGIQGDVDRYIPHEAKLESGWRYRNKITGKIDSIDEGGTAVYISKVKMLWHRYNEYVRNRPDGALRPEYLEAHDLTEDYVQGEYKKRRCNYLDMGWVKEGNFISGSSVERFNRAIKNDLLTDLNLWCGGFYENAETEFLIVSEFDRLLGVG